MLRAIKMLIAGALCTAGLAAQVTPAGPKLSAADQGGILYASNFGQWQIPAGNLGQYSWNNASYCQPTVGSVYPGITINGFAAGTPVEIVDLDTPAHSEIVIPSAYYIAPNRSSCSISISPIYGHNHFYFASATAGLQEALNWAGTTAYEVILTPDWTLLGGTTSMITAAQGNANVTIFDQRTSGLAAYGWIGGAYVLIPWSFSGGGIINTATNGQIAYYAAPGNTLSGESYVTVAQGGTDSTTAAGALANLGGQPAGTYVTSLSVTTANGLQGSFTSGAAPALTLNTDSTHVLPVNTGASTNYLNQAGTYSVPPGTYTLPSDVVKNDQANTFGAYLQTFGGGAKATEFWVGSSTGPTGASDWFVGSASQPGVEYGTTLRNTASSGATAVTLANNLSSSTPFTNIAQFVLNGSTASDFNFGAAGEAVLESFTQNLNVGASSGYSTKIRSSSVLFPDIAGLPSSGKYCTDVDSTGKLYATSSDCGSSGGSGTVNSAPVGSTATYNATGTAVGAGPQAPVCTGIPNDGSTGAGGIIVSCYANGKQVVVPTQQQGSNSCVTLTAATGPILINGRGYQLGGGGWGGSINYCILHRR